MAVLKFLLSTLQIVFLLHQIAYVHCKELDPVRIEMDTEPLNLTQGQQQNVSCTINRGPRFFTSAPLTFSHEPISCVTLAGRHSMCGARNIMAANALLYQGEPEFYDVHVIQTHDKTVFDFIFKSARTLDTGVLTCRLWARGAVEDFSVSKQIYVDEVGPRTAE